MEFSPADLFPGGMPQSHIFCMHCSQNFMFCSCTGLGHGEGMYFALPKVPDSMPLERRLQRWAALCTFHPLMQQFNAKRFLEDQGPSYCARLNRAKPFLTILMEEFKTSDFFDEHIGKNMNDEQKIKVRRDCDLAISNLFSGLWGQIKYFEWIMLNNAVQMSSPGDFTGEDSLAITATFETIVMVMNTMSRLTEGHKNAFEFQMEDVCE